MAGQCGKLVHSSNFQQFCEHNIYILQPTGSHSSKQNGLAEKENKDLAQIMHCLLYSAGLESKFWSYTMRHSVDLKNRLYYASFLLKTRYEALYSCKPDLSHLRVFGSITNTKSSAKKYMKIDSISIQ